MAEVVARIGQPLRAVLKPGEDVLVGDGRRAALLRRERDRADDGEQEGQRAHRRPSKIQAGPKNRTRPTYLRRVQRAGPALRTVCRPGLVLQTRRRLLTATRTPSAHCPTGTTGTACRRRCTSCRRS